MSRRLQEETPLMQVERLGVTFYTPRGVVRAVREPSLEVRRGELVGLAGESGCGKSTAAFAVVGYLPGTARVDGSIRFEGRDIPGMSASELRHLRGNRIAMVYQDPATSLNPTMRVGHQIEEVLREHLGMDSGQARQRTANLFESVGLAEPDLIGRRYPHQLSGGMQQRVVIAMALACDPDLLIMDEPTTGLDVKATILDLVVDLKQRVNAGILYVSHNPGVIARVADRVVVMYAGQTVEQAPVDQLFKSPKHPYTTGLLDCVPQPPTDGGTVTKLRSIPGAVYAAEKASTEGCLFAPRCRMVQDSCRVESPQMLDVGDDHQSRCFLWIDVHPEIWGELRLRDEDLAPLVGERTREQRAAVRMVFQNPTASLNPRLPIRHAILRSLRKFVRLSKRESRERAEELLEAVGLDPAYLDRYPGELSGGEQQRVALAVAFAGNADIVVADEAVSALDASVQAQVLNLLHRHQQEAGMSYIFISHDLGVVRYVSDDIVVLYAGHVAESGPTECVPTAPSHPYTEALLSAAPVPDPDATPTRIRLPGAVPSLRQRFQGCFFAGRCPRKIGPICDHTPPPAQTGPDSPDHVIYCHIDVDQLRAMQQERVREAT